MKDKCKANMIPDPSRPRLPTTALSIDQHQGGSDKSATGVKTLLKLPREQITIGTWNVRTLYQCGKIIELEYELSHYK